MNDYRGFLLHRRSESVNYVIKYVLILHTYTPEIYAIHSYMFYYIYWVKTTATREFNI